MNRLRVRIGERVREYPIEPSAENAMFDVENAIDKVLRREFNLCVYALEYLGEYAWDILIDSRKVGHAKAWDEPIPGKKEPEIRLWSFLLLCVFAYGALL